MFITERKWPKLLLSIPLKKKKKEEAFLINYLMGISMIKEGSFLPSIMKVVLIIGLINQQSEL